VTDLVPRQPTTIVATGIITVCCGLHIMPPTRCCDASDCAPCCAECPTCPIVQAKDPEQRRAAARENRDLELMLVTFVRADNARAKLDSICRTTAAAVTAAMLDLPMTTAESDIRRRRCPGCVGTSLTHTFDHRCDWHGLQHEPWPPWPPEPVCTCVPPSGPEGPQEVAT